MLDAAKLRRHILQDPDVLHDLILRYAAGDKSVKQTRDWMEAQVWREMLGQMEAGQSVEVITCWNPSQRAPGRLG